MQLQYTIDFIITVQHNMTKLLISEKKGIRQIALTEDEELLFLDIDGIDNHKHCKGNIYCGFISRIPIGTQGIFVKYENNKEGFLSFNSIHPNYLQNLDDNTKHHITQNMQTSFKHRNYYNNINIHNHLYIGQKLLVQIIRDEDKCKNSMLSTFISIGTRLSYVPNSMEESVFFEKSLSIVFKRDIKAYYNTLKENTRGSFSFKKEVSIQDINDVIDTWKNIQYKFENCKHPQIIHEHNSVFKTIFMEIDQIDEFIINSDNPNIYNEIKEYWQNPNIIENTCIFKYIKEQIEDVFSDVSKLLSGGYLLWNISSFCTNIDVNMGNNHIIANDYEDMVLQVNFEAVQTISKQIHLRNIGGLIVIDFLKMKDTTHQQMIYDYMKSSLKNKTVHIHIENFNSLGVMMISRQFSCGISLKNLIEFPKIKLKHNNLFND